MQTMSSSENEADESFAHFIETEILAEDEVDGKEGDSPEPKRRRMEIGGADSGVLGRIPPELLPNILKFLSSEDLMACSMVCKTMNYAACDESLWRQLYRMRWGLPPQNTKIRQCAWKKLYIQRDEEDMADLVQNCHSEFKEFYIQMQAAKRSQAPVPSQVNEDRTILDKTLTDQVSIWKRSKGFSDNVDPNHYCSGETCTYHQIGDVFVCEKTGNVHVCDDTCREIVTDPTNELLVCRVSGHCFDRMLSPAEMEPDTVSHYCHYFDRMLSPAEMEPDTEHQQGGAADEAEPFMGSGRLARAYDLGYNCNDEKELKAVLRFC